MEVSSREKAASYATTYVVNNQYTDDITELQERKIEVHTFSKVYLYLHTFLCDQMKGYCHITKFTLEIVPSFVTVYLCAHA